MWRGAWWRWVYVQYLPVRTRMMDVLGQQQRGRERTLHGMVGDDTGYGWVGGESARERKRKARGEKREIFLVYIRCWKDKRT